MHGEDGSSLPLGQQLRGSQQPQNVHFVSVLRVLGIGLRRYYQHCSCVPAINAR